MREIVLDTETTGLDPAQGHRLVEIAGVELVNRVPTGEYFHVYLNPQRPMPEEAFRVHGLSAEFLADKLLFPDAVDGFLAFVAESPLVIHNAEFDMRFLNWELGQANREKLPFERAVDSLAIARRKHPGASNSLDALCARYRIDASRRVKHGALLDAQILAEVYGELTGGRQSTMILLGEETRSSALSPLATVVERPSRDLPLLIAAPEFRSHARMVADLGAVAVWNEYLERSDA
jgi:DNA polymerase III subunit epsilon